MKKNQFILIPFCLSALILSTVSCDGANNTTSNDLASVVDVTSTAGYKYGRDIFKKFNSMDKMYDLATKKTVGHATMPTRGHSKMLVVPVLFSDSTKDAAALAEMKDTMNRVFFGKSEDTGWESVSSFYYKSSYHQLKIEGEVSKEVKLPNSHDTYAVKGTSSTNTILNIVYTTLFPEGGTVYNGIDYDSDKDGIIDGIYLIQEGHIAKDFDWAFTTVHGDGVLSNTKHKELGTYAWSSIDFATRGNGYTALSPDAHTYIHETGHILGNNDYYDTHNSSYNSPAGGNIMQDNNIVDHDAYSKFLFGWTSPKIVTDKNTESTIEIELRPTESSGDCLVLATNYNDTSLDEYLMIEYYTPTGLNEKDSKTKYESCEGLKESGIKIWHADKRVYDSYLKKSGTGLSVSYTTYFDPNSSNDPNIDAGDIHSETEVYDYYSSFSTNSSKDQNDTNFYINNELELMRATYGTEAYDITKQAKDADLFKAGATFGTASDAFKDFEFYDVSTPVDYDCEVKDWKETPKNKLAYSIKVDSIGETAKLTLTRK